MARIRKTRAHERALRLFSEGYGTKEVSAQVGVCYETARTWRRQENGTGEISERGFVEMAWPGIAANVLSATGVDVRLRSGTMVYGVSMPILMELKKLGLV